MLEIKIERNYNKYFISKDDKILRLGIMTGGFFYEKTIFYLPENLSITIAEYKEKRLTLSTEKRSLFIAIDKSINFVYRSNNCYFMSWKGSQYLLCYKRFEFDGFYLNGTKIGTIDILKVKNGFYNKIAVFEHEGESLELEEYLVFVYLYIVIDYFDVN